MTIPHQNIEIMICNIFIGDEKTLNPIKLDTNKDIQGDRNCYCRWISFFLLKNKLYFKRTKIYLLIY